jgi:acyl-CoA reductase-like NAD-dependent aldehyde dehydrogenase
LRPVAAFRRLLVARAEALTAAVLADVHRPPGEVTATDLLPTAAACKFLQQHADRILKPRRVGGTPLWLFGCRNVVHRRPWGVVGLIGTWNYPVFITAVPLLHALTAGNAVLWKPSEHTPATADRLHELLTDAGYPADLIVRVPGDRDNGPKVAEADLDFVHFTGSDAVGRRLAARLGERLIPSGLELSGVDAVVVRADADVGLAARSAWYGATLNAGQTCMAARRVYVHSTVADAFLKALRPLVESWPAVRLQTPGQVAHAGGLTAEAMAAGCDLLASRPREGTECPAEPPSPHGDGSPEGDGSPVAPAVVVGDFDRLRLAREATFAPLLGVCPVADDAEAVGRHNAGPFGLSAAVFSRDTAAAADLAARLHTGSVVVNDVIVPTAHPGTPFGGRRASGWGVTQGAEGLLAMTVPQVVTVRRGSFRPHVDAHLLHDPAAADVAAGLLQLGHGTLGQRLGGLRRLARGLRHTRRPAP